MQKLTIKAIHPHDDFTMDIDLSNGTSFVFDLEPYLNGTGLKKLHNIAFFKQAKFKGEVLYWDEMHDFPLHCMEVPERCLVLA